MVQKNPPRLLTLLTEKDILEAYNKINLKPLAGAYFSRGYCCPVSALALANNVCSIKDNKKQRCKKILDWSYIDNDIKNNFIEAYDGKVVRGRYGKLGKKMRSILIES